MLIKPQFHRSFACKFKTSSSSVLNLAKFSLQQNSFKSLLLLLIIVILQTEP